jgi:hypothetical protein
MFADFLFFLCVIQQCCFCTFRDSIKWKKLFILGKMIFGIAMMVILAKADKVLTKMKMEVDATYLDKNNCFDERLQFYFKDLMDFCFKGAVLGSWEGSDLDTYQQILRSTFFFTQICLFILELLFMGMCCNMVKKNPKINALSKDNFCFTALVKRET